MGLLDRFQAYIAANTPRNTRAPVNPATVLNEGLLNPNKYNAPAANRFKDSAFGLLGIVPGVGDAASAAQSADLFNRGDKFGGSLAALGALPLIPALGAHTVYHGSPHKFDKFDMSKIGTGEGAQAYGHGLYFAENPDVAKSYLRVDQMKPGMAPDYPMLDGQKLPLTTNKTPEQIAAESIWHNGGSTLAEKELAQKVESLASYGDIAANDLTPMKAALDLVKNPEFVARANAGRGKLYKVDIPDESIPRMLDWDAPLSKQHESVRRAIGWTKEAEDAFYAAKASDEDNLLSSLMGDASYQSAKLPIPEGLPSLDTMGSHLVKGGSIFDRGSDVARSEALRKAGIPGIKYYDGLSRGDKGGTRNYVLFDDQLARILEINGQPTGLLPFNNK